MKCAFFKDFMREQERRLREAIDENKWYMSERAGYDVGFEAAEYDFYVHHLHRFAHEFRVQYCGSRCPGRWECELAARIGALSAARQTQPCLDEREGGGPVAAF